jgi:excisionase family DNA binding protein
MDRLLTLDQVCDLVQLGPEAVRRAVRHGDLAASKLGGRLRFRPADVDQADNVHRLDCRLKPPGQVVSIDHVLWRQRAPRTCDACRSILHTVLGGPLRFRPVDVDTWIDANRVQPVQPGPAMQHGKLSPTRPAAGIRQGPQVSFRDLARQANERDRRANA